MFKFFLFLSILILQVHILAYGNTYSSKNTPSKPLYAQILPDTIDDLKIFENDSPLNVTLKYDITSFIRNKKKSEYQNAVIEIQTDNKQLITRNIRLKARGNYRRDNCAFPPIRLNFDTDPVVGSELTGKVKLVSHCSNSKKSDIYVLREYLVYKLYNVLTDNSFRVRLLNISYIDSSSKKKDYNKFGFIIEPLGSLAKRNDSQIINPATIRKENVIEKDADLVALFHYMIGNTDWRIKGGHNSKYIKPYNKTSGKVITIPYDFDFSGFVATSYSFPQTWTSIKSVQQREYLGYCRDSDEAYLETIERFEEKKEEIFNVIETFEFITEKERKILTEYIEEFYTAISKPEKFVRTLKYDCRTDF